MRKRHERRDIYTKIDVPYEMRHSCFYCGEYEYDLDHVPPTSRYHDFIGIYDSHQPILVPSCKECNGMLSNSLQKDIYERFDECKKKLTRKLSKYLRYELIWYDEELEYADFTGEFEKFSKAVPKEIEKAKQRLSWDHWPVSIDGIEIENVQMSYNFKLDGKEFRTLDHLLEYVKRVHKVPVKYFEKVLLIVGYAKVDYALRICQTQKVTTEAQMNRVLEDLAFSESDSGWQIAE